MRTSEAVMLGYLAYLVLVSWLRPIGARRRVRVLGVSLLDAAGVLWLSSAERQWLSIARDWAPSVHLLVGYWLAGAFFIAPMPRLEAALARADDIVFVRWRLERVSRRGPRWLLEYFELSYLSVYVIVPIAFGVVYWWTSRDAAAVDAYWSIVLVSGLACYGLLPWLQSLPPGAHGLHTDINQRGVIVRRLNVGILRGASVQVNTLPSGHAATAFATAFATASLVPGAWLPLGVVAMSISVAAVIGRYHYAVDSALGLLVAMAAWGAVSLR